jgi:hypothetical protein
MKNRSLLFVALLSLAGVGSSAFAQEISVPGKTRAEVKAETLRAIKAGEVTTGEDSNYPADVAPELFGGLSRVQVKQDTLRAIAAHQVTTGEDVGYPQVAPQQPATTSAQVDTLTNRK